ncbi:MAG TPA: cytidylate kinase-like family protein [Acidimicrobiia bacterium]|nr:cytidylate kinase-like family protein [Acidimicrobiia bacterium]
MGERENGRPGEHDPHLRVVTISATYGAGGSRIAPMLAQRLGLPFADRLIPADNAAPLGVGTERLSDEEREQYRRTRFFARLAAITGGLGMPVPSPETVGGDVRDSVEASIYQEIQPDGAVILGRAASIVLAAHPRAFHVRLDGPKQRRLQRGMAFEHIDEATARARLEETDRARARYVERVYGADPSDPTRYHLTIDSTALSAATCVDVIVLAAGAFWGPPE